MSNSKVYKTGDRTFCTKCGQKVAECRCEEMAKELMDKYNKAVANGEGNVIEGEKVCNTCIHPCKASGKRTRCSLYDSGLYGEQIL